MEAHSSPDKVDMCCSIDSRFAGIRVAECLRGMPWSDSLCQPSFCIPTPAPLQTSRARICLLTPSRLLWGCPYLMNDTLASLHHIYTSTAARSSYLAMLAERAAEHHQGCYLVRKTVSGKFPDTVGAYSGI